MSALPVLLPPPPDLERLVLLATNAVQAENTRRAYSSALRAYVAWWASNGQPALSREVCHSHRAHLQRSGLSASRINQSLAALTKLAEEAERAGAITYATLASIRDVDRIKQPGGPTGNWLDEEQLAALLNRPPSTTLQGLRDRALLALLVGSSMRRAEVARCAVEQFCKRDNRWVILNLTCKGNKVRTIPIHDMAAAAVQAWLAASRIITGPLLRAVEKNDNLLGRPLSPGGIYFIVRQRYAEFAVAPHDLRRTAATNMRRNGASLEAVSSQLGHATIGTTVKYLKASASLKRGDVGIDFLRINCAALGTTEAETAHPPASHS